MQPGPSNQSGVRFISGIICKSKVLSFERMLFRTTRGNMLFNQAPADDKILDPASNEMVLFLQFPLRCIECLCNFQRLTMKPQERESLTLKT